MKTEGAELDVVVRLTTFYHFNVSSLECRNSFESDRGTGRPSGIPIPLQLPTAFDWRGWGSNHPFDCVESICHRYSFSSLLPRSNADDNFRFSTSSGRDRVLYFVRHHLTGKFLLCGSSFLRLHCKFRYSSRGPWYKNLGTTQLYRRTAKTNDGENVLTENLPMELRHCLYLPVNTTYRLRRLNHCLGLWPQFADS